jgi:D-arginine dehydrogenase
MDTHTLDVIVVGAGIAGATAGAHLAADHKVALIEAEEIAGFHSTGRSAALWILNYGPPDVRVLTGLSRAFFDAPPPGFTETPIMAHRPELNLATADTLADYDHMMEIGVGLKELTPAQAAELVPALRPGHVARAAIEDDTFDMDVAALHQGFLRTLRARGGQLALRSRSMRIERKGGLWEVEVTGGVVLRAPTLVNAAGAWGDEVAIQAGLAPIGLQPKRRTGVIINPEPWAVADWPAVMDCAGTWYCRAEARTRLMVSPADETAMDPQDIQPDELDVAIAIDRMQQALDINVTRVERSWAGLRSFVADGSLAFGWDDTAEGFFWFIGQGGYGIQTSPAAGRFAADLISHRDPGEAASIIDAVNPNRFKRPG